MYNKLYKLLIEDFIDYLNSSPKRTMSGVTRVYKKKAINFYKNIHGNIKYDSSYIDRKANELDDLETIVPQKTARWKYRESDKYKKVFGKRISRKKKKK